MMLSDKQHKNKSLQELKSKIFRTVLILGIIGLGLSSLVNIINSRPFINFIMPFGGMLVTIGMLYMFVKGKHPAVVKDVFLVFLCNIYLPSAWLTSPGSYSAMNYYGLLIIMISIILVDNARKFEYFFPISVVIEMMILINLEPYWPEQYKVYSLPMARSLDLSVNFLIVATIIFSVVYTLNRYFDSEHHRIFTVSVTDQLTGIYNRHYLLNALENNSLDRKEQGYVFIMMDLNNFKKVNDVYGHSAGDEVLRQFADALVQASRKSDIVARYGGDEFVLVLMDADLNTADAVISRITENFTPVQTKYEELCLSIGFGTAVSNGKSLGEIMKIADLNLYRNKSDKKVQR